MRRKGWFQISFFRVLFVVSQRLTNSLPRSKLIFNLSGHHSATGPQCLLLNSTDAVWYGESCTVQKPYICKIPSLPEAPTTTMRPAVTCPVPKPPCQEEWTHSPVSNKCYKVGFHKNCRLANAVAQRFIKAQFSAL